MKFLLVVLFAAWRQPTVYAQDDPAALIARLHEAQHVATIDDAALKPWHLKLEVTLYGIADARSNPDAKSPNAGNPADANRQGTVEEWWEGVDRRRVVYSFPSYQATYVTNATGRYRSRLSSAPPNLLSALLREAVDPMPPGDTMAESTPILTSQQIAGNSLDCIALAEPAASQASPEAVPISLAPTYCLAHGSNLLRLSFNHGAPVLLRSTIGSFQGRSVPLDIVASRGKVKLASAHVAVLEMLPSVDPTLLAPAADLEAIRPPIQVDAKAMAGYKLAGDQPFYPAEARKQGIRVVLLSLLIGDDGRVKEVIPMRSPDPRLTDAAVTAIRT